MKHLQRSRSAVLAMVGVLLFVGAAASGCSQKAKISKTEEANWKGGPMPPEFAQEMARKQKEAQAKAQSEAQAAPGKTQP